MTEGTLSEGVAMATGRIHATPACGLVRSISENRGTGTLVFRRDGLEKSLHFSEGRIQFATSSDPDDRFGIRLLRNRQLFLDQIDTAMDSRQGDERIGDLLVETGALTEEDRVIAVREQLRDIVLDVLTWTRGCYEFKEGASEPSESIQLEMETDQLILESFRRQMSVHSLRESIGGSWTVLSLGAGWEQGIQRLDLRDTERLLIEKLKDGPSSIGNLCKRLYVSHFEILQAVAALQALGWVVIAEEAFGDTDCTDFVSYLVELCADEQSGILEVRRNGVTRTFHLKHGRCTFATSDDADDRLVHFLLRRGIITLQDAEEATRRLLTNKRSGTILLELGAIDHEDLTSMVRQHLTEIVCETIRWPDAEMNFLATDPPRAEEIRLEVSIESLVAAGVRRVLSWKRIEDGLGGLDRAFALEPDYLSILDAMGSGQEEWEVVTALKEVPTAREVCDGSRMGAQRVGQIIWALYLLGAVRVAQPAVESAVAAGAGTESGVQEDRDAVDSEATESIAEEPIAEEPTDEEPDAERVDNSPREMESDPEANDARMDEDLEASGSDPGYEAEETDLIDRASEAPQDEDVEIDASGLDAAFDLEEPARDITPEDISAEDIAADADAESGPDFDDSSEEFSTEDDPSEDEANLTQDSDAEVQEIEGAGATMRLDRESVDEMLRRGKEEAAVEDAARKAHDDSFGHDATQQLDRAAIDRILAEDSPEAAEAAAEHVQKVDRSRIFTEDPTGFEISPDATQQLRPEHLQAARDGLPPVEEPETGEDDGADIPGDAWEAPLELGDAIADFNAMQRIVFRAVKMEIGAGAVNFIRANCVLEEDRSPVGDSELLRDGAWDPDGLRAAAMEQRLEDPRGTYRSVIDREIDALEPLVGERRASKLRKQVSVAIGN